MASEGAGGLSTEAIERCIDNWETETQDGAEIPAARAELAALQAAVIETGALRAALLDETARRLWTERVLQDRHSYPVGWDWDVGPAVREHWRQVARERLGYARTVETLAELLARRDADAGPGAAGARDETAALGQVERAARAVRHVTFYGDTGEVGFWGGDRFANRDALAELSAALVALDALRAGGAG
jgi:hypothetical protein